MIALSLWQPWATLWASGSKQIETRSWSTQYRGELAVHAAKKWTRELKEWCECDPFYDELHKVMDSIDDMPLGCVVGVVRIIDCRPTRELVKTISNQELQFGDYEPGRFGFVATDFRLLKNPIPYKGQQGFFDIPDEILRSAS